MQKDVRKLNDKANTCLEQMEFQVKFLDDDASIQDKDLVMTKVGHFLHSLIMTEDINTFQTGSHLEHLFKAHAWEKDMLKIVEKVERGMVKNGPKLSKMLHGLELTAKFLDDDFEGRVEALGPPTA